MYNAFSKPILYMTNRLGKNRVEQMKRLTAELTDLLYAYLIFPMGTV
jgi:hypothetical protein